MVRAVFEGVALNSAWLLGAVEKYTKRRFASLAFVGGGANSDLWSQIHADVMGRDHPPDRRPGAGQRAGRRAAHPSGARSHPLADIPSMVEVKAVYTPDEDAAAVYAPLLKEFVNLYDKTKGIHKRLNGRIGSAGTGAAGPRSAGQSSEGAGAGPQSVAGRAHSFEQLAPPWSAGRVGPCSG